MDKEIKITMKESERKNAIAFLKRSDIKGAEAELFLNVIYRLMRPEEVETDGK